MTLIRIHVKINTKANVLKMTCYYVTVVDCLDDRRRGANIP